MITRVVRLTLYASSIALAVAGLAAAGTGLEREASADAPSYSIDDWLAVQGTACQDLDADSIPCEEPDDLYLPPSPNYLGWSGNDDPDGVYNYWGAVDYAGLSADWLLNDCPTPVDLGTTTSGSVSVRDAEDGQVLVSVRLHTRNALGWAADNTNGEFNTAPLLFGARTQDVCDGASPSLLDSLLRIEYYADPDNPMVDYLSWPNTRSLRMQAHGPGTFVDGSPGHMTLVQNGPFQSHSHSNGWDFWPAEFFELQRTGN